MPIRINKSFSIEPDVLAVLEKKVPKKMRSKVVNKLLREFFDMPDSEDELMAQVRKSAAKTRKENPNAKHH